MNRVRSLFNNGGFSLTEVLIAAVVFTVIFTIIISLFLTLSHKRQPRELLSAIMLAEEYFETRQPCYDLDSTVLLNGNVYRLTVEVSRRNELSSVILCVVRVSTADTIARYYTEVFQPEVSSEGR